MNTIIETSKGMVAAQRKAMQQPAGKEETEDSSEVVTARESLVAL